MNTYRKITYTASAALAGLLALPVAASAQTESLDEAALQKKAMAKTSSTTPDGWTVKAKVGLSANLGDNNANAASAGAGQEGTTFQFGLQFAAEANLKHGNHGLENKLGVQHAQTKTPSIDAFIKTQDNLELISTYVYRLDNPSWLGPFGRFKFQTQIFPGYAVRETPYTVFETDRDGNRTQRDGDPTTPFSTEDFAAQRKIDLTGALEAMVLRESGGMFARPFTGDEFKLDAKVGAGAQHIVVRDGYVVLSEDAAAGVLELRQLQNVNEIGAELEVNLEGVAIKDLLSWKLGANFFLPVVTSAEDADGDTANGFGYLNTDVQAALSLKLSKWASLDYSLIVKKIPLVVDGFQVIHGLVLSAGFDIL